MTGVHKVVLTNLSKCPMITWKIPQEYKYYSYLNHLRRNVLYQLIKDMKNKVYDFDMLGRIIQSGQLDDYGCLTVQGMQKMRFYRPNYGFEILN